MKISAALSAVLNWVDRVHDAAVERFSRRGRIRALEREHQEALADAQRTLSAWRVQKTLNSRIYWKRKHTEAMSHVDRIAHELRRLGVKP